jgi:hypothetical protein
MCLLRLDRMEKPYLDPDIHPMDVLLYRARAEDMDTVIIAREVLLRRGAHTRVDKGDVLKQLRDRFSAPVDRQVLEARQMIDWLLPLRRALLSKLVTRPRDPHNVFNSRT